MKRSILFSLYILLAIMAISNHSFAQTGGVSINKTGAAADSSAILDVSATDKGFLPPRMTQLQRDSISGPATGLVIYQTDGTAGLYCNNGTAEVPLWQQLSVTSTLAYGYFYFTGLFPMANATENVTFPSTGISSNMHYDLSTNSVIVNAGGIYKISYHLFAEFQQSVPIEITVNGIAVNPLEPSPVFTDPSVVAPTSDEVTLALNANDIVAVAIKSTP